MPRLHPGTYRYSRPMTEALLAGALVASYLAGAIPFSNIAAHIVGGIDLRDAGTGTVTPRNLLHTVGLWPAVIAGIFEVGKGMVGPVLVGPGHLLIAALAGALAVAGHNWSIFLKGRGGRGLSTATGALCILSPPGAAVMCVGLAVGVATRRVGPAMCVAVVVLLPVLALTGGLSMALAGLMLLVPMGLKTVIVVRQRQMRSGSADA